MSAAGDGQPRWVPSFGFYAVAAAAAAGSVFLAACVLFWWALGQLRSGPGDGPPAEQTEWD